MSWLKRFALFLYDFVVGDDWRLAAGVVLALLAGAGLEHLGVGAAWLAVPVVVLLTLVASLRRSLPQREQHGS